ncbi:helix-turn-helix domain-containing protein [Curtobacterium flaccumfaciens pv. flaccumfaciens]|uniref:helix-turn-helix domain-containing protein n=1 Tax=Curtobacterium flaccumfaciens TaxID=2035 RepID=UPI003A4D5B2D
MGNGGQARPVPAELSPEGWPTAPSLDPHAELARQFNLRLREAIGDRSVRTIAAVAGMSHSGLNKILAGQAWPDMLSISRLEHALGVNLWPSGH